MRRTRHRRRFHTDRIVANRRRRYWRESSTTAWNAEHFPDWFAKRMAYGMLADRDPWDCGRSCILCHYGKFYDNRRAREGRQWREAEGL